MKAEEIFEMYAPVIEVLDHFSLDSAVPMLAGGTHSWIECKRSFGWSTSFTSDSTFRLLPMYPKGETSFARERIQEAEKASEASKILLSLCKDLDLFSGWLITIELKPFPIETIEISIYSCRDGEWLIDFINREHTLSDALNSMIEYIRGKYARV